MTTLECGGESIQPLTSSATGCLIRQLDNAWAKLPDWTHTPPPRVSSTGTHLTKGTHYHTHYSTQSARQQRDARRTSLHTHLEGWRRVGEYGPWVHPMRNELRWSDCTVGHLRITYKTHF